MMSCFNLRTAASVAVVDSGLVSVCGAIGKIPIVDKLKNIDIFAGTQQAADAAPGE
jgi:hypothetical protein